MRPPLVLGLAPSPSSADGGDFWGSPSGARLARLWREAVGHQPWDGLAAGRPDFANVWGVTVDRNRVGVRRFAGSPWERRVWAQVGSRHVLALGRAVASLVWRIPDSEPWGALSVRQVPTGAASIVAVVPHPSPRNREWNNPEAEGAMVAYLRAFYVDWRAAVDVEVYRAIGADHGNE